MLQFPSLQITGTVPGFYNRCSHTVYHPVDAPTVKTGKKGCDFKHYKPEANGLVCFSDYIVNKRNRFAGNPHKKKSPFAVKPVKIKIAFRFRLQFFDK